MTPEKLRAWMPIAACLALLALFASPASALTTSWTNAAGGNWNTAGNWDMGVPGPADDAVIALSGTYTVTLDVSPSVASLSLGGATGTQTLSATTRTLTLGGLSSVGAHGLISFTSSTVNGTGSLANSGTVRLASSTASVPIDNAGLLDLRGATSVSAAITTAVGSTLTVPGVPGTATVVNIANGFTNNGIVSLNSGGGTFAATLNITAGTLVNAAGASIQSLAGTGGARTLNAQLDNQGTITVGAPMTINKASADHVSSGTIDVTGGTLSLTQSGTTPTFTNSGAITIGSGLTLFVTNGAFIYNGGALPTNGDWNFTTVAMTLNADFTIPAGLDLNYAGGSIGGTGQLISNSTLASFTGATLNVPLTLNASTGFGVGTTNISGGLTTGSGVGFSLVGGNGDGLDATVNVASGFTNSGTITLTATGQFGGAFLSVTSGSLTNTGTIVSTGTAPAEGERSITAEIINTGDINVGIARLDIGKSSAHHVNTGTINVSGDDLAIGQSGTAPSFTTSGSINVSGGKTFTITNGAFIYDGGAPSILGTFQLNSATVTLNDDYTIEAGSNTNWGATVGGPGRLINNSSLTNLGGTLNVPLENHATVALLSGTTTFNGEITTFPGSSFTITAQTSSTSSTMTVNHANGFTNNGSIVMTTLVQFADITLNVTAGTLTNTSTGSISTYLGSGGARNLNAQVDNQGTITAVSTGLNISKASADHVNSGTIAVSGGTLVITQSGTTPSVTNSGTITIGSARLLQSLAGTFTNAVGGLIEGAGTLQAVNFTNNGTLSPGLSPGILTVLGNCPFSNSGALDVEINGSTVGTEYDRLSVGATATLDGTLNVTFPSGSCVAPGGSYRVVQAGTRVGTFDAINVAADGNPVVSAAYDGTGLTLSVVSNNLTVTASAGSGGTISPSGAVAVPCGGNQSFAIASDPCFHLVDVLVDGNSVGPVTAYDFTDVRVAHTISATFEVDVHTITASAGSNGSIGPSGAVAVNCGDDQVFTITPAPCYHVVDVLVDGASVGPVTSYTFAGVTADHTIAATFAFSTFTIAASAGPNGSISPSGAVPVNCGDDQAFTITAAPCYHVDDVLVDGASVGPVTSYTFTGVAANHTIAASFAQGSHTIMASAGAGGSISPSGAVPVNCGDDQAFMITPASCFQVDDVLVDGSSVGAVTSYTFSSVSANHTIAASFVAISYTISASAGANGSISPSGAVPVGCGADQVFTITADACYHVEDVLVDGSSAGAVTSYTFTGVSANHTIAASFTANGSYTLTASAGAGGAIDPSGAVPASCGSSQAFTITPDACHHILDLLVDGSSVGAVSEYTFTDVQANHTIAASFAIDVYALTTGVIGGGTLAIDPDQPNYDCGAPVGITAQPSAGWQFDHWTGDASGSDNPLAIVMDADKSITAVFVDVAPPVVGLTSPNGSESWYASTTHAVTWSASDNAGVTGVDLAYSADGGVTYPNVIATGLANTGSFNWVVPNTPTLQARVRVTAHDAAALAASDASDANFEIKSDPTAVADALLAHGEMFGIYPNPASAGEAHVLYRLPTAATVDLSIFDVTGRMVRTLETGRFADGTRVLTWDGRDDDGRQLSPGVYLVRLASDSGLRATERLVLLR